MSTAHPLPSTPTHGIWPERHPAGTIAIGLALMLLTGPVGVVGNAILAWRTRGTLRALLVAFAVLGLLMLTFLTMVPWAGSGVSGGSHTP